MIKPALLFIFAFLSATAASFGSSANSDDRLTPEDLRGIRLSIADFATYADIREKRNYGPVQLELMKIALFKEASQAKVKSVIVSSQNPEAQALVDRMALGFFRSRTVNQFFCPFLANARSPRHHFGVSEKAAMRILKSCAKNQISVYQDQIQQRMLTKVSKQVVFLEEETPSRVESWTSAKGDIHIFHRGDINEFELARALLHEYYISFDSLSVFSAEVADYVIRQSDFVATGPKKILTQYYNTFAYPLLRGSFQLSRALYFENMVFEELTGIKTPAQRTRPCWDLIRSLAPLVIDKQDLFVPSYHFVYSPAVREEVAGLSRGMELFDEILELEKKAQVNGSLCEILRLPGTGGFGTFYVSGPRPRIGNGTDTKSHETAKREWPLSFENADPRLPKKWIHFKKMSKTELGPPIKDEDLPTKMILPKGGLPE